ncbi:MULTISPECIES: hypothetical protein [Rhizobium]|uniref:hypothetical protein n=1 Tax=Rhizobium TaxID=379 RepID=UPI00195970CF|nr:MULTISPECIES: hypothetical protein [Rhizobium]MBM7048378.1 hypothetical protein [Rhizobium lusitanum]
MRRYHHLVEGVLQPEEIDNLQRVFNAVIAEPWFNMNELNHEAFAADVIKLYRRGVVDLERLHHLATLAALAHFSRDMPEEKQKALKLLHDLQGDLGEG